MALVLVLQVVYALISPPDFARKSLRDADSYMRVLRVVDLHDKGRWYDSHFDRTNAPFGETLHWGRPLDALLYGMAWPIARFVDFRTAAFLSGMFLGPVLMLLSIPLWSWGTRPTLSDGAFLLLFGLMSMTTQLRGQLELARPDHHGFLIVLFVAQFAAVCRLATRSGGRKTAVILGIAGGVALWASVEGLLVQAAFALTLAYLLRRGMEDAIGCIAAYAISFWATVTIALMLERPPKRVVDARLHQNLDRPLDAGGGCRADVVGSSPILPGDGSPLIAGGATRDACGGRRCAAGRVWRARFPGFSRARW